jgi:IS605 OrfB family transposase
MADAVVINKADGDNIQKAKMAQIEFNRALHLFPRKDSGWQPKVTTCSSLTSDGITEVYAIIIAFISQTTDSGYFIANREAQNQYWMMETINEQLKNSFYQHPEIIKQLETQEQLIINKKKSRTTLIKSLLPEKNEGINDWELNTPKGVRDGAIIDICNAYKTGFSNLKLGNIKFFKMHYKSKTNPNKYVSIPKSFLKNKNGIIHLSSDFFKEHCKIKMGKKTLKKYKDLKINNDSRIIKQKNDYFLIIPIQLSENPKTPLINYCGIDPGVRTFMTSFGNNECIEYHHDEEKIKVLNSKISILKNLRRLKQRKRILKKQLNKIETKKENLINELHWKVINDLLNRNDVIFYGDIKSHDVVKNNNINRTLNRNINDLKFFKFKERLLFKASEKQKRIILVNEAYTSQTCCFCGAMYKPGCSKIYECKICNKRIDRDINASKNILMKGILSL